MNNTSQHFPRINVSQLQLVAQYMQLKGIVLTDVFNTEQIALINTSFETSGPVQISSEPFNQILKQLAHYLNEPTISLSIASMIKTENLGILGYLLHASSTLGEALLLLKKYGKLINNEMENMLIAQEGEVMHLTWKAYLNEDSFVAELGMAIMMQFTRQLIDPSGLNGQQLTIHQVSFHHKKLQNKQAYEDFFACPVLFDQPFMRFSFPLRNLSIALEKPDKILLNILQSQAEQALKALPESSEFIQAVNRHLMMLCQHGEPKISSLAGCMNMSTRTLQRRFSEQHASFQEVLDAVRQQLCTEYLQQHIQLSDIAQLLGYSDQSAFTRAYKRWTGSTPHQQRIASQKNI